MQEYVDDVYDKGLPVRVLHRPSAKALLEAQSKLKNNSNQWHFSHIKRKEILK